MFTTLAFLFGQFLVYGARATIITLVHIQLFKYANVEYSARHVRTYEFYELVLWSRMGKKMNMTCSGKRMQAFVESPEKQQRII